MSFEARLDELGIVLPIPRIPAGNYRPAVVCGGLVFTSGQGSALQGGEAVLGRLGAELDVGDGYGAARICGLNCLAAIRFVTESLDSVEGILEVRGFVNATPDFEDHPAVMNGTSDLLVEIFGAAGRHVRSAIGVASLPKGFAVEVELVARIRT
jgi:enamine deaminase RidA (YjgF/YER057c/UK114 family)